MKIDFLVAGMQKAATTAVHSFLSAHPKIYLPPQKELHFFDNGDDVDWSNPDYSEYHRQFRDASAGSVVGEVTPIYTYWPRSIERIYDYNRDIRLIVMLRCPVARAYSHWKMETTRGREKLNFSQAIREGRQRVSASSPTTASGPYAMFSYVERGFYAPQIRRLFARFPREQVLFATTNMLSQDFHGQLDRFCGFLGVESYKNYPEFAYVRPPVPAWDLPPMQMNDRLFLISLFERDIAETAQLANLDLSSWTSGYHDYQYVTV